MVGSSGAAMERLAPVTATPRNFPARTCGKLEARFANITETWPAMRSVNAGAAPLYGTCTISTLAIELKSTAARCVDVPLPADAYRRDFGFERASAITSFTDFAGT